VGHRVTVEGIVTVSFLVVVTGFSEGYLLANGHGLHVGIVVSNALDKVVSPGLEPFHPVDEQIRLENCPLDLRARFPAVSVLSDRDECLCSCNVTRDLARKIPEDEKR